MWIINKSDGRKRNGEAMDKLIEDFEKSLFTNIGELTYDYAELGIDSIINNGMLKDIPIVRSLIGVLKIGKNIHDRNLLKQSLNFIQEFNSGGINEEKLEKYRKEIEENPKKAEKEIGRVLLLLNIFIDKEKSIMLAKIFKTFVEEKINWNEFCEFSEIINRLFIQDIQILKEIKDKNIDIMNNREDEFRVERLYSLGLIGLSFNPVTYNDLKNGHINSGRNISPLGRKLCDIIL